MKVPRSWVTEMTSKWMDRGRSVVPDETVDFTWVWCGASYGVLARGAACSWGRWNWKSCMCMCCICLLRGLFLLPWYLKVLYSLHSTCKYVSGAFIGSNPAGGYIYWCFTNGEIVLPHTSWIALDVGPECRSPHSIPSFSAQSQRDSGAP